jgi:predicted component of type VI protein secretion system
MNVKLIVENGARRRVLRLRPPEAILGRGRGNAVRIPSAEVSRQHCRLILEDGIVHVEDMNSVNGTFLNDRKTRGIELVRPGDRLSVGPVTFSVEYELTPSAVARLPEEDDPAELLELLGDGDVILEAEDMPPLSAEMDEDDLLPVDDGLLPVLDDLDELPVAEEIPVPADSIHSAPWQMPDGNDFRDMLSQLADEDEPPSPKKKR